MTQLAQVPIYEVPGVINAKNTIYEPELVALLQAKAVKQLAIVMTEEGYWLAVLAAKRAETTIRTGTGGEEKVTRLRRVRLEVDGFAPLYAVRNKKLRVYRSLDTLLNSLTKYGDLPLTTIQKGNTHAR